MRNADHDAIIARAQAAAHRSDLDVRSRKVQAHVIRGSKQLSSSRGRDLETLAGAMQLACLYGDYREVVPGAVILGEIEPDSMSPIDYAAIGMSIQLPLYLAQRAGDVASIWSPRCSGSPSGRRCRTCSTGRC